VGSSGKDDGDLMRLKSYPSLPFDKETVDLGGIAAFKPPQFLDQHGLQGIGDRSHDNISVLATHLPWGFQHKLGSLP
jgi:hypothetical protein